MWTIIAILLIIWLAVSILGFIIEGLFWLAILGIVLFVVTAIVGGVRGRRNKT
ncbi:MAG: hypothetical protein WED09_02435 [Homoserinimonas sp.]